MICPHCSFKTPAFKSQLTEGHKAAPKVGNFSLCLECGGYSIITGLDSLRKATKPEYVAIQKAPELLLLGRLREYAYNLHTASEAKNKEQVKPKK